MLRLRSSLLTAVLPSLPSIFIPLCTPLHAVRCNPARAGKIFRVFYRKPHKMLIDARACARETTIEFVMQSVENILKSGLTLTGCKLAADSMSALVAPLGLSILATLWSLGRTRKSEIFKLISRDWTTVSHNCSFLIQDGYVKEEVVTHKEKYLSLTTKGTEVVNRFILEASRKADAISKLMPVTHIANRRMGSL